MPVYLPELPYKKNGLSPHISEETLEFHYRKHHAGYVKKLNAQIQGTEWDKATLEEIVKNSKNGVFNNSAQVWNHNFYWKSLSPKGSGTPTGEINQLIEKDFSSWTEFKESFTKAALGLFGAGWVWIVEQDGKLKITTTTNAKTPLTDPKQKPLLTCDVWEHAYYIDYRNARPAYIEAFWNLINWEFANKNLQK